MIGTLFSSSHPHTTTPSEDDLFSRLRLLRSRRVGISTYRRLLAEHGTAQNALDALPEVARAAGVADYKICPEGVIKAELNAARAAKAFLVCETDADYPQILKHLGDAPPFLWCLGQRELLQKPAIALVGARNASSLGTRMAKTLAAELGEAGFVIVSGLARGIDAAAHHASIANGTIAVQAGGVDVIYPTENTNLAHDIAQKGLRMSEMPMGLQPRARHFPSRNRIISGLATAVVVIEAAAKSGSLITARNALDQNKEVLAVPGHPFDARAAGCNFLIRDGAILVRNAADVIEAINALAEPELPQLQESKPAKRPLREVNNLHNEILSRLGPSPIAEDQLIRDLQVNPTQVAPALVDLELDGSITRQSGGLISKAV